MTDDMDWTPEKQAKLRELWDEGLPTVEIGRRLGCSKNAVIGKARRMHLTPRPNPVGRPENGGFKARAYRARTANPTLPRLASLNGKATTRMDPTPTPMPEPTGNSRCQYQLWGAMHADDRPNLGRMHADPRPGPDPKTCGVRCEGSWCWRHRKIVFSPLRAEAA